MIISSFKGINGINYTFSFKKYLPQFLFFYRMSSFAETSFFEKYQMVKI